MEWYKIVIVFLDSISVSVLSGFLFSKYILKYDWVFNKDDATNKSTLYIIFLPFITYISVRMWNEIVNYLNCST